MGILYGNGIGDQANDGNWACICICLIEAITGNLDIPGGGGAGKVAPAPLFKTNPVSMLTERLEATDEDVEKGYAAGMSKLVADEFPAGTRTPTPLAAPAPPAPTTRRSRAS